MMENLVEGRSGLVLQVEPADILELPEVNVAIGSTTRVVRGPSLLVPVPRAFLERTRNNGRILSQVNAFACDGAAFGIVAVHDDDCVVLVVFELAQGAAGELVSAAARAGQLPVVFAADEKSARVLLVEQQERLGNLRDIARLRSPMLGEEYVLAFSQALRVAMALVLDELKERSRVRTVLLRPLVSEPAMDGAAATGPTVH